MASYLSNLIKTTTSPLTALNTSIFNQARNVVNSARYFAVASSKKKIAAAKARPALTSGKKAAKSTKSAKTASSKTAKKPTAVAKKADKLKKERALKEKEKEKEKLRAKKEKERENKRIEDEKAKAKLQAQREKAKEQKEAEKEKLARQKEKEKERVQKAKDIANEKKEKAKIKQALIKADKDKRPKRLPTAYSLFYSEKVKAEKPPGKGIVEFAKKMGEQWRALDEASKQAYKDEIAKRRPAYEEARKKYLAEKKANTKLTPYNKFIQQNFSKVKEGNPNKHPTEIMKLVVNQWRELPAVEKQRLVKH